MEWQRKRRRGKVRQFSEASSTEVDLNRDFEGAVFLVPKCRWRCRFMFVPVAAMPR